MLNLICATLKRFHFSYQNELELQDGIAQALSAATIPYEREKRLTPTDRPDFFVDGIVLEVKIKGATRAVLRQLNRYAGHESVKAILLVTTRSLQAFQVPESMNDKPVRVLCLTTL